MYLAPVSPKNLKRFYGAVLYLKAKKIIITARKSINSGAPLAGAAASTIKPANIRKTKTTLTHFWSKKKYRCLFVKPVNRNKAKLIRNKIAASAGII